MMVEEIVGLALSCIALGMFMGGLIGYIIGSETERSRQERKQQSA